MQYQIGVTIWAEVSARRVSQLREWLAGAGVVQRLSDAQRGQHQNNARIRVGLPGAMSPAPARPVRRHYRALPQFVRTRGGAYFFLPSISALRYLVKLPGSAASAPRTR
jgi:hypothetical protein